MVATIFLLPTLANGTVPFARHSWGDLAARGEVPSDLLQHGVVLGNLVERGVVDSDLMEDGLVAGDSLGHGAVFGDLIERVVFAGDFVRDRVVV